MAGYAGVSGGGDEGGGGGVGYSTGRTPGSSGTWCRSEATISVEWKTNRWPLVARFVAEMEDVHLEH